MSSRVRLVERYRSTTVAGAKSAARRILLDEAHAVGDTGVDGGLSRQRHERRLELEADALCAVALRCQDHQSPVTRPEVVDDVIGPRAG